MLVNDRRKEDEIVRTLGHGFGQRHHPGQGSGRTHDGHAAVPAEGVLSLEGDNKVQRFIQDPGEGMGRIESDGGQHGHQFPGEVALDPVGVTLTPVPPANKANVLLFQRRYEHIVQHSILIIDQIVDPLRDALELLSGAQIVRSPLGRTVGELLLKPCHPDLKKLVKVGRRNAQKA